jgi:hypothetical protein
MQADSLPLGITAAGVELGNLTGQVCSQYGVSSASCSASGSTATAVVANGQGGMASVSLGSSATYGAAVTEYYFGLLGPTTESVPIIVNGYASTQDSGTLDSFSYGAYYIYQGSTSGVTYVGDYFASPSACAYFTEVNITCLSTGNFTLNTTVTSNSVFFVFFEAAADGTNASALVDPTITIDPSFADASEFTLEANPGVFTPPASPAAAPEPASAGLLAFALSAIAAGVRRARGRKASS